MTDFRPNDAAGYVYDQMADHLAARIESGELAPNTPLPNERRLAEEYAVSLGTARHATRLLRYRGLVVTLRAKGTYIADHPSSRALETETVPLFERKDAGETAVNELAGIALCPLEMGMEMLGAVPEFDSTELDAAVLSVLTALNDRVREAPDAPTKPQYDTRVLHVGGLVLTLSTQRPATAAPTV
ncbi:GntR family transcriptional regulator [Amycolatopsis sp. GM8]|uniref:GntR family transcriptional regulator n=1 Tax=Amycolatopsis sp. GM8 TaxID=2896530 RepID=UPI0035ABD896